MQQASPDSTFHYFLQDGGAMGAQMRSKDWKQSPLGDPGHWPANLQVILSLVLNSPVAMLVAWGPQNILLYNDTFSRILEPERAKLLGTALKETGERLQRFLGMPGHGHCPASENQQDNPIPGDTSRLRFSYSPLQNADGTTAGVLLTASPQANVGLTGQYTGVELFRTSTESSDILRAAGDAARDATCSNSAWLDNTQQATPRQRIKKGLRETRSLIESAPFPIGVYTGSEMRIAFANKAILDIWGKGANVIGKLFSDVLPELGNQEVFQQLDTVYTSGEALHIKNKRLDLIADGKEKAYYFNYSLTPLFDAHRNVYGVMSTGFDATEVNMAKRKVEASEETLRNTILQAPVAMCIFKGPAHIVEIANARMLEFWGKDRATILHKPIFDGLPEAREQGFEAILDGVYATGDAFYAEAVPVSLPRKGNLETVYVNFAYEAYKEAGGEISGILAVAVDVTAQVLAQRRIEEVVAARTQELAETNFSLQKSNNELAQFAYVASHDLQEPLRKISIFCQMLAGSMGSSLTERSAELLTKIDSAAKRMTSLIRDVLSYSELAKEGDEFEKVNLGAILESLKIDYELLIAQKNATITCDALPQIEAIPLQMAQLFGNLVGNALKFSKAGEPALITITTASATAQECRSLQLDGTLTYYKITITDNGIGISPEHTDKIFSIFKRLHQKTDYEGTGIGLALCKKIALNHKGEINAQGSSSHGAVFNIFLPAQQPRP